MITTNTISEFLDNLDISRVSERSYRSALNSFYTYLVSKGIKTNQLTNITAIDYKRYMIDNHLSQETIRIRVQVLKKYSRYLYNNNLASDFANSLKVPAPYRGFKKQPLSSDQLNRLLDAIPQNTISGLRDIAIVTMMIVFGLRECEISRLDIGDIRLIDEEYRLYVQGKGKLDKSDSFVMDDDVMTRVNYYLDNRDSYTDESPLFVNHGPSSKSDRMTPSMVGKVVVKYMRAVGLPSPNFTAHSLRHTTATNLILAGLSIYETQQYMRHSSTKTTELYTKYADSVMIRRRPPQLILSNWLKSSQNKI